MPRIRRGRHTRLSISLTPTERQTLEAWQRTSTLPAARVRRGRLILLVAAGRPLAEVARMVGISRRFVYKWVRRFLAQGVEGLHDRPRLRACPGRDPGPPSGASPRETMPGANDLPSRRR